MSATASKPMTKTEVISALADATGLAKPQVNEFFEELTKLIAENLKEGGPGVFNVPGENDGMVDFECVLAVLKNHGYTDWVIVEAEQDPYVSDPLTYAMRARTYVTDLLKFSENKG